MNLTLASSYSLGGFDPKNGILGLVPIPPMNSYKVNKVSGISLYKWSQYLKTITPSVIIVLN